MMEENEEIQENEEIENAEEESSETEEVSDEALEQIVATQAPLRSKVEAVIFASPKPMKTVEIFELLNDETLPEPITIEQIQEELDSLLGFYEERAGGFTLKYVKRMGYQYQTTNSVRSVMEKQFASRPRPLSRASLETLAVVAYRQKRSKGVTRAEVEFIRGVDAGGIFKTLVERGMLHCTGRKEIPGRPLMFVVTDEFLKTFQLSSTDDLPPLESFQIPQETLTAAQEKISAFEAEQEAAVNPEKFIGDSEYRDENTMVGDIVGPDISAADVSTPDVQARET